MALHDRYDNRLNTNSVAARDAYDRGMDLFLSANYGAIDAFLESVREDPGFALGHAALARACLMGGDMPGAQAALRDAKAQISQGDAREAGHIGAVALLLSGQPAAARAAVYTHAAAFPRDVMAIQLNCSVFGLIGFSGLEGREAELLSFTSTLQSDLDQDWWWMSMHALALCEIGQIDSSLHLMEQSLAINPRNANAAHFKSHALYEAGETSAGRTFLDAWMADYNPRSAMHGHLSWHQALWALHDCEADTMWRMVDAGVGPGAAQGQPINVLTDTAAILFRAELAGFEVTQARWAALSDYAVQFFPECGQSFADIHAALSHAMAGDGARLARIAETDKGFAGDLAAPVARAWGAMARDDWSAALRELTPVMAKTERLGGSRAQRDLLELAWVHTLMKLGKTDEARRALGTRRPVLAEAPPLASLTEHEPITVS